MKKNGLRSYVSLSQYGYDNIEAYRDSLKSYTSQIVKEDQIKQVSEFMWQTLLIWILHTKHACLQRTSRNNAIQ